MFLRKTKAEREENRQRIKCLCCAVKMSGKTQEANIENLGHRFSHLAVMHAEPAYSKGKKESSTKFKSNIKREFPLLQEIFVHPNFKFSIRTSFRQAWTRSNSSKSAVKTRKGRHASISRRKHVDTNKTKPLTLYELRFSCQYSFRKN